MICGQQQLLLKALNIQIPKIPCKLSDSEANISPVVFEFRTQNLVSIGCAKMKMFAENVSDFILGIGVKNLRHEKRQ